MMISTDPNRIPFNASMMACSTVRSEKEFALSCSALNIDLTNIYIADHIYDFYSYQY